MFGLETDHRLAMDSRDFAVPGGSMEDCTNHTVYLEKMYRQFVLRKECRSFAFLDLGCSAGRLVEQVITDGHFGAGLEGSDYPLARQRSAWSRIPNNLFTCDITKPFTLYSTKVKEHTGLTIPFRFDVISAFEVLEHLPKDRLTTFFENVSNHLVPDGIFTISVSNQKGYHHSTVESKEWWTYLFDSYGFKNNREICDALGDDWPRGPNDPSSFNMALQRKEMYPE